ncbi:hypothetical protein MBAV_006506 [Candidatus Magnetobacterium bavaricum]|uniref:Uncharacterized protein n=1 Tax=Candidatus Magnetobacterium bavaricum TaxID=29290 RepID=A0A0F3GH85_9BACT|nr:hypothetical protein MBAV_006506 [Candidatus Magnetobacterium bavaricum]
MTIGGSDGLSVRASMSRIMLSSFDESCSLSSCLRNLFERSRFMASALTLSILRWKFLVCFGESHSPSEASSSTLWARSNCSSITESFTS